MTTPEQEPLPSTPLRLAALEVEAHVAADGWDQAPRLYALVRTAALVEAEPSLAAQLAVPLRDAPDGFTTIEQELHLAGRPLEDVLEEIQWPDAVDGCAVVVERIMLPPEAEEDLPSDPAAVATLARRQERELRSWLYGEEELPGDSWAAALRDVRADVEETHRIAVELVVVGDVPLDAGLVAVVRAAREAVVNAAKHAGVDRVDVYAEVGRGVVEVYVRDRGTGFDPDAIADDRMGVRGSIIGRVENHGGTARVRSGVDGTEVALTMPLSAPPAAGPEEPR